MPRGEHQGGRGGDQTPPKSYEERAAEYNQLPSILKSPDKQTITAEEIEEQDKQKEVLKQKVEQAPKEQQIQMVLEPLRSDKPGNHWEAERIKNLSGLSGDEIFASPEAQALIERAIIYSLDNEHIDDAVAKIQHLEVPLSLVTGSSKIREAIVRKIESARGEWDEDVIHYAIREFGVKAEEIRQLNIPENLRAGLDETIRHAEAVSKRIKTIRAEKES